MADFKVVTFTVGELIGMLPGSFIGHSLSIQRADKQVFNNVDIEFKRRIIPALRRIDGGENEVSVIAESFEDHDKTAVNWCKF
jgi:hypothetical protein